MFHPGEYKPHPSLKPYIKSYWTLKSPDMNGTVKQKQFLSDSGVKISFNLADPVQFGLAGSKPLLVPKGCVSGPLTSNFRVSSSGCMNRFGIQFHPGGAYPFISEPAFELKDGFFDLEEIWGVHGKVLTKKIRSPELTTEERIQILEPFLLKRLEQIKKIDPGFEFAVGMILSRDGQITVDQLSRATRIGHRQLERKFKKKIGISPKLLCRILRFRNLFTEISNHPDESWASIAYGGGYYDQAHMIHDFKSFTGLSPSAFVEKIIKTDLFINWGYNFGDLDRLGETERIGENFYLRSQAGTTGVCSFEPSNRQNEQVI